MDEQFIRDRISSLREEKGISETFAMNYIYLSGLTINSTQDSNLQEETENEFEKKKYQGEDEGF